MKRPIHLSIYLSATFLPVISFMNYSTHRLIVMKYDDLLPAYRVMCLTVRYVNETLTIATHHTEEKNIIRLLQFCNRGSVVDPNPNSFGCPGPGTGSVWGMRIRIQEHGN
jgi:hypothetical protein